jgi:hypothetical protein
MFDKIFNFVIGVAECNSAEETPGVNLPSGKWAVPVAIAIGGTKAVQHLPPKERLPGLTLVLGFASANAMAISAASCLKKIEQTGRQAPAEPLSPRGGPFAPSPFEKIYDFSNSMEDMSPLEQLKYVTELMDAISLFGIFALSVYLVMAMLNNEKIFAFLVNNFPLPKYRAIFEKFLNVRKMAGLVWGPLILVGIMSLFWDIHFLCSALLKAIEPNP